MSYYRRFFGTGLTVRKMAIPAAVTAATVLIILDQGNVAPTVNAGTDPGGAVDGIAFFLDTTIVDDGLPAPPAALNCTLSETDSDGICTFEDSGACTTDATCDDIEISCDTPGVTMTISLCCDDDAGGPNVEVCDTVDVAIDDAPVLPNDALVYGAMPEGGFWIASDPYVDCDGDGCADQDCDDGEEIHRFCLGTDITSTTKDLECAAGDRPTFETGGVDGRSYAQFIGTENDVCTSATSAFAFRESDDTNEVVFQVVMLLDAVDAIQIGATLYDSTNAGTFFTSLVQPRTCAAPPCDIWRMNGNAVVAPDNIDISSPAPDTNAHVQEIWWEPTEFLAYLDGVEFPGGGTGGLDSDGAGNDEPYDQVRIGNDTSNGNDATGQFYEMVIAEGRTSAQLEAYRELRISAVYPSIIGNTAPSVAAGADDDADEDVAYALNATVSDDGGAMDCQWAEADADGSCVFENSGECTGVSNDCDLDVTCDTGDVDMTLELCCTDGVNPEECDDLVLTINATGGGETFLALTDPVTATVFTSEVSEEDLADAEVGWSTGTPGVFNLPAPPVTSAMTSCAAGTLNGGFCEADTMDELETLCEGDDNRIRITGNITTAGRALDNCIDTYIQIASGVSVTEIRLAGASTARVWIACMGATSRFGFLRISDADDITMDSCPMPAGLIASDRFAVATNVNRLAILYGVMEGDTSGSSTKISLIDNGLAGASTDILLMEVNGFAQADSVADWALRIDTAERVVLDRVRLRNITDQQVMRNGPDLETTDGFCHEVTLVGIEFCNAIAPALTNDFINWYWRSSTFFLGDAAAGDQFYLPAAPFKFVDHTWNGDASGTCVMNATTVEAMESGAAESAGDFRLGTPVYQSGQTFTWPTVTSPRGFVVGSNPASLTP